MRVLFIGSRKYDYLQDLTYSGMNKVLGINGVISHHFAARNYLGYKRYPKNIPSSFRGLPGDLFGRRRDFKLVILAASKPDCFRDYLKIAPRLPASVPVIFIDGGDRKEIGGDLERLGHPELYSKAEETRPFDFIFKREYLLEHSYPDHVKPLPLSFNFQRIPRLGREKKYDVTFWAVEGHPIRSRVLGMLRDRFDCMENGSTTSQEFRKYERKGRFYLKELAASRIALSFRGGGWDTLRYWEIPATGACMVSQPPEIRIPNNFEHGRHALFCKPDASDLIDLCGYYLEHEDKREKIALEGRNHALKYHSDISRASYILSSLSHLMD